MCGNKKSSRFAADNTVLRFSLSREKRERKSKFNEEIYAPSEYLNPEVDVLFQRPKDASVRFSPEEESTWFERKVLGHNTF